ncbi:MAG: tRNA pseudouridine(55) synthase TruB [Bacteroidales bacterium]|nr:tRNA pseudouridine(55) synthase TruB [Bacteroidales bacterium]MBN2756766.1 tRNA pseudouridine(55) synthase TruB [Bacteroidales bacterium]
MNNNSLSTYDFKEGEVLLFEKPLSWTSFDLVRKIRSLIKRKLNIKNIKVGHAGTLDPLATGLMILCTGNKTKEIEKFQATEKEYIADIFIGATTPSFDLETEINNKYPTKHIDLELINQIVNSFIGKQEQMPPQYSAKRIDGQRAYKKAHQGIEVEMKPSEIEIYNIEILNYSFPDLKIKINCSKGTYIRSLANDIGKKLNSGAYLSGLIRTKIGDFKIENAIQISDFKNSLFPEDTE